MKEDFFPYFVIHKAKFENITKGGTYLQAFSVRFYIFNDAPMRQRFEFNKRLKGENVMRVSKLFC